MSARHIPLLTPAVFDQLAATDECQVQELNREMKDNLKLLENDVKEAKMLVRQTQSKVEELAVSIDKMEDPKK